MKVIQRYGKSKPTENDLLEYQMGYDTRENQYGKHEGKEMFINDNGQVRALNENYLKEEFVDYVYELDENGQVVEAGGKTVYQKTSDEIHGVVYKTTKTEKKVIDEDGKQMGTKVRISTGKIDTRHQRFNEDCDVLEFYSIDPMYIAQIKDAVEQKALYVVDTHEAMLDKIEILKAENKIEAGVQFIVKDDKGAHEGEAAQSATKTHDEEGKHYHDTWLYVISQYDTAHGIDEDDNTVIITLTTGETYALKEMMPLEYQFHDIVAVDNRGLGLEVEENHDDNTASTKFTDHTVETIICAHDNAFSSKEDNFGKTKDESPKDVVDTMKNGQKYTNYVELKHKVYSEDGECTEVVAGYIDFNDFILDEGSWDK